MGAQDTETSTREPAHFPAAAGVRPLRILLADAQVIFRQGVRTLLQDNGFNVVAEAGDGGDAIRLAQDIAPDVAILDLALPHISGPDAAEQIAQVSPQTLTILLTMDAEEAAVAKSLQAGIRGYVLKTQSITDLVQAIREVAGGGLYLSPGVSQSLVQAYLSRHEVASGPLTAREFQVLRLVAEGKTTREAAELLGISAKTAESHRMRIMTKLGIHDTAGLVRYAVRQGLIQP